MRRNPSYRADWERYAALPEDMRPVLDGFGLDPPAKEGETLPE